MLRMDQYELVRTSSRAYGKNICEISRETGHSRNTIKKVLNGEFISYRQRKNQPYPVLAPHLQTIDIWLMNDKEFPKKQRHTARRIFNRLKEEHNFKGCESTVRQYVRAAKVRLCVNAPKAFIPLSPDVGKEAEIDWGTSIVRIANKRSRLKYFCMRSKYSGKHFLRFYHCERQQAFFDAHIQGFDFFGGVFNILIYDNLTTAVRKILKGKNRLEQESYVKFRSYYNFQSRFCNPGAGHEKGGVEGMVGFVRRNYMVPVPEAESLEELNQKMLIKCIEYGNYRQSGREQKVDELFESEKPHLLSIPQQTFSNIHTYSGKVNKYATVISDKNRYSVPTKFVGFKTQSLLLVDKIEIHYNGKIIASHIRSYGKDKWILDPDHYLDLIQQRPMSFNSAKPIKEWRKKWPNSMELLLIKFCKSQGENNGIKDFLSVLMFHREYEVNEVQAAIDIAVESNISSSDGVKQILIYTDSSQINNVPLKNWPTLPPADITIYGQLGGDI